MLNILNFFKNKYIIAGIVFIVWITFFSQYDIISQKKQREELSEMKRKISYLDDEIKKLQDEKEALKSNPEAIEKYSREKYFMKKKNETIFVFDTTDVDTPKSK